VGPGWLVLLQDGNLGRHVDGDGASNWGDAEGGPRLEAKGGTQGQTPHETRDQTVSPLFDPNASPLRAVTSADQKAHQRRNGTAAANVLFLADLAA
jgi:hypothetical protein